MSFQSIYLKNGIATGLGTFVTVSNQNLFTPRASGGNTPMPQNTILQANVRGPTVQRDFNPTYQGYVRQGRWVIEQSSRQQLKLAREKEKALELAWNQN